MSELFKVVLTASFTLIGGVVLLVITQIFTRFIVDPLVDFRRLLDWLCNSAEDCSLA